MAFRKAKVRDDVKEVAMRRCPWDPNVDHEVVKQLKPGDTLKISDDRLFYDWVDDAFYEVYEGQHPIGYIKTDAVILS